MPTQSARFGLNPPMRLDPHPTRAGFSLLETLIALAVLALAMTALVRTAGLEAQSLAQAREHALAQWVAADVIAEARLESTLPASALRQGHSEMGDRRFRWTLSIATTDAGIRRLDVAVFAEPAQQPILILTGFAGTP